MSGSGTTAVTLSAECTVAKRPGFTQLHGRCRQTKDIPVHHSAPHILLQRRCRCACHVEAADPVTEDCS
ncbi:hypothetical protein [Streptomyces sp. NBC_01538]|uniref:hypothetical protein n=1 Tax=Streptomyces sp. NBC_01538 TaxID=2903897 RepID=UPI001DAD10DC|nr:hypothetical protein [Streptomyces turgidiscabies]